MPLLLQAEDLRKTYIVRKKRLHVLRGVSLDVGPGEILSIVGVSGAGKSTLLHILGGLDRPDNGRVAINGKYVYELSPAQRARIRASLIGFVFQSYHLLPEMDVLENVLLPAMSQRGFLASAARMRSRALELLDAVGLADRAWHTPMELSGGEQQRVAIARALMNNPELVLADEPTGNLDSATGGHVLNHLISLTRKHGHALVVVTHDERLADLSDRILRLSDGRLTEQQPHKVAVPHGA